MSNCLQPNPAGSRSEGPNPAGSRSEGPNPAGSRSEGPKALVQSISSTENAMSEAVPYKAPMGAAVKPTQFKSGAEEGKTNTCLQEMSKINKYFMDLGQTLDQNLALDAESRKKKPVHIIFTNNSLIETKQWKNKVASFGVNTMAILSSQDTKSKGEIDSLILTGDDAGRCVNYIMCCANGVRVRDVIWIIKQYFKKHPRYVFNIFLDEFDKMPIYAVLVKAVQGYTNVKNIVAISATPYASWFSMLSDLGYNYVPLLTKIEDASEYRRISDHRLFYTNAIQIDNPVANFRYILDNAGAICYQDPDDAEVRVLIPDLKAEKGKIFFVPGTWRTDSHDDICAVANGLGWNCLVLNGKKKGYYYADETYVTMKDYRARRSFPEHTSIMAIAQEMYNDPGLCLKEANLVITGFNCVERGVTFNVPNFQFHTAIFSPHHFKEGSEAKESIIQLAGRATGWKTFVPPMNILAPKYLLDEVSESQDKLIQFLKQSPTHITYADMMGDKNAIPIRLEIRDAALLTALEGESKGKRLALLRAGIQKGLVQYTNPNRPSDDHYPFMSSMEGRYTLKTIRSCKEEVKAQNYRFDAYCSAHDQGRGYGQSNNAGEFSIDINFVTHVKGGVEIPKGLGFISYAYLEVE